jgi:transaldolase
VTAIYSFKQVKELVKKIKNVNTKIILSVFCGRIADTGRSPLKILKEFNILKSRKYKNVDLLWASTREILNIYEAENAGCDIITVSKDILSKLKLKNKSLIEYSRETVCQFIKDAKSSGLKVC